MPRPSQPPRLWFRKPRKKTARRPAERGVWVILADGRHSSTGCGVDERAAAEAQLAEFIVARQSAERRQAPIEETYLGDILALYLEEVVPDLATAKKTAARIERVAEYWGAKTLNDVTRGECREFAKTRTPGAARRELQDLSAAINYHKGEKHHHLEVRVFKPRAGRPRERWLTRAEVASLLRLCLHTPELQGGRPTAKRPLRHLAPFILFALYTGSRPGDVLTASFAASSSVSVIDLDQGLFYRKPSDKQDTTKRQPTTPLPFRLQLHLRRWKALGAERVVEFEGRPVGSIKTAFAHLLELAKLPGAPVVPYSLRHTCATWKMQAGEPAWSVAGFIGSSEAMILKHYGHHSPSALRGTAEAATQVSPQRFPNDKREHYANRRSESSKKGEQNQRIARNAVRS